jgi:hypothetical protein
MWSCGGSKSSSSNNENTSSTAESSSAGETSSATAAQTTEKPTKSDVPQIPTVTEGETVTSEQISVYDSFTTSDEMFSFSVKGDVKQYIGSDADEYEFAFKHSKYDAMIGVVSVSGMHQTAKGFSESIVPHYQEVFNNVSCTETEVNGLPAQKLTAVCNKEGEMYSFSYTMVQYGNGDLFVVMETKPMSSSYSCAEEIQSIFDSLSYYGAPVKTKEEVFDSRHFSITVGKELCIDSSSADDVFIKYNFQDTLEDSLCKLNVTCKEGTAAKDEADSAYQNFVGNKYTNELRRDTAEMAGHSAEHFVRSVTVQNIDVVSEIFYFDENGITYKLQCTAPKALAEKFMSDVKPVMDSMTLK